MKRNLPALAILLMLATFALTQEPSAMLTGTTASTIPGAGGRRCE